MPTTIHKPQVAATDEQPPQHKVVVRCARQGCERKVKRADKYQHCSGICYETDRLLRDIEALMNEMDDPNLTQLWAETVEASNVLTRLSVERGRIWWSRGKKKK